MIAIAAYAYMSVLAAAYFHRQRQRRAAHRRNEAAASREYWVHPINEARDTHGVFSHLVQEMRNFPQKHHEYFRMSPASFDHILSFIRDDITKQATVMRLPIAADLKLALTLHHLATGSDFGTIHKHWRVGRSTAAEIVNEVCQAIWNRMSPVYLRQPTSEEDWVAVAKGFEDYWNFPNCVGAIDGKHIPVQKPSGAGSEFFCYKKFHSIVLMAIADSRYRFLMVDVGQYGSESDGGVWQNCQFHKDIEQGDINFPPPRDVAGHHLPYCFVGDEAFPLKSYLMRPFPGRDLGGNVRRQIYNYRLSRARRVVENAFGILSQRWQVVKKPIIGLTKNVETMIAATTVLHNYLCINNDNAYLPPGTVDIISGMAEQGETGLWRCDPANNLPSVPRAAARNFTYDAAHIRRDFTTYFNEGGAVPWQFDHVNRRANRL